jgi:L-rhamnonate dehydratase
VLGLPVYRLLGGPTRERIPAYASMLGFALQTEDLQRVASEYQQLGYPAQKWFFRWGPGHGPEGAARNVEMVRAAREALGPDARLMVDAFNSWDAPYAIEVGRRISEYRPFWLEEPVPVDRLAALRAIRQATGLQVATGEHLYTRWQARQLLEAEAADIIQADPDWCGGISELVKIAAVCSAHDVPLYPHGHSLHAALHLAAACSPTVLPMVEFLVMHQRNKQAFMKGFLQPEAGLLSLPEAPGLGIEIDAAKVESSRYLD